MLTKGGFRGGLFIPLNIYRGRPVGFMNHLCVAILFNENIFVRCFLIRNLILALSYLFFSYAFGQSRRYSGKAFLNFKPIWDISGS